MADLSYLGPVLEVLQGIAKGIGRACSNIGLFFRGRKSKNQYKDGKDAVENGDVDKINDILKEHKKD